MRYPPSTWTVSGPLFFEGLFTDAVCNCRGGLVGTAAAALGGGEAAAEVPLADDSTAPCTISCSPDFKSKLEIGSSGTSVSERGGYPDLTIRKATSVHRPDSLDSARTALS